MLHSFSVDTQEQGSLQQVSSSPRRLFGLGTLVGFACAGLAVIALSRKGAPEADRGAKFVGPAGVLDAEAS